MQDEAQHLENGQARQRLERALDKLEAAAMRRVEGTRASLLSQETAELMREDRARLAQELDSALARVAVLEEACNAATRRVDAAVTSVRGVLQRVSREAH